jgi:hydroxyethylthiazole kinase-like uncharacterized protein yjeF
MLPLLTREGSRAIDLDASTRLGVPSAVLMENAGRGACDVLCERLGSALSRVLVVGGLGQNGGDAWVLARQLLLRGRRATCLLVGEPAAVRGDARTNLSTLERMGVTVMSLRDGALEPLDRALAEATLVVDGLFGTGLDRAITGLQAEVINRINARGLPCLALDIPSGIDADSGAVLGVAIHAQITVSFATHKRGLHQHPGAAHGGEVICASIGVPAPTEANYQALEARDVADWLPPREADTHKGRGGHVLVVAGAPGHTGAAVLSGLGALRAGAGLVTLCPRAGARSALDAKVIELMTADMPAELEPAVAAVKALLEKKHAAVVGPGLGVDDHGSALARRLALELDKPAVLDADALTAFSGQLGLLRRAAGPRVLTPHPGEAARLLGWKTERVQAERYAAVTQLAAESGQVCVLKGARSLIGSPDGGVLVCPLDVPALAVAGTGDVLSGVIGALLGQLSPQLAAAAGVYLHAAAGALAAAGDRGLFAHEVADAVPRALANCRR